MSRVASGVPKPKSFKNLLVMDGSDGRVLSREVKLKHISTRVFSSTGECHIHLWLKKKSLRQTEPQGQAGERQTGWFKRSGLGE
jgi:hypothetical protein